MFIMIKMFLSENHQIMSRKAKEEDIIYIQSELEF